MSRLRVLHCIYDDPDNPWLGGGGARRVLELYRRLTAELEVTVAAGAYPGAEDGSRHGVRYRYIGRTRPYALSRAAYGLAATSLLHRGDYDAALFDFSVYSPVRVPENRPVGHVVHMLMGPTAERRWGRLVGRAVAARERAALNRARQVSVTSEWLARRLRPLLAPEARVHLVRSGVDPEFYDVARAPADHVLYYGRFDTFQKGLDVLLEAAPRFLAGGGTRLVLAGRGKDAGELRERVARLDPALPVEVVESPDRARVLELLAGALVVVHPSRFEGYPVVPAEAMAAGVPVVATDVGAVAEIVDGSAGVLVPPEDPAALAEAVGALLTWPDRRSALSAAARRRAAAFSWDVVAAEHLAFVRSIAAGSAAS